MTITRLAIEGKYKENCLFAGLAIYQRLREEILFCSNRSFWDSNPTDNIKDTYHTISPFNDMNLVIYDIRNYTMISTSLIFNISACNGISINPCEYEVYCGRHSFTLAVCKSYLDSLTDANAEFLLEIQFITLFESLHKIAYGLSHSLILKQNTDSCSQIYFSSCVKARKQNIFQNRYHIYFSNEACVVITILKIDLFKNELRNLLCILHMLAK